jgi:flagellar hook-associated protein 2
MRPSGSDSLAAYGIIATKDGTLELRADRLQRQLALKPTGLDTLIGSAASASPSGIAGSLDTFVKSWNNAVDGQIMKRKKATSDQQRTLTDRQASLDKQHEAAYNRYLRQFTALQTMQSAMNSNLSMFDAMFGKDKD